MEVMHHRAINWETLLRLSDAQRAAELFATAQDATASDRPLVDDLDFYTALLNCDVATLTEAYQQTQAAFAVADQLTILDRSSEAWPLQGVHSPYIPPFLYAQGNLGLLKSPTVAVLGTRTPSKAAKELTVATAEALGKAGVCVVGGLSSGVEALAHRSALAGSKPTIGISATELGSSYPVAHQALQAEIGQWGLLISRFAPGTEMEKVHLLLRNRLMSLLCDVLLIVEDRDGGTAVRQAEDALGRKQPVIIYQRSSENHSLLWPRRLSASSWVTVIKKPKELRGVLAQILGTKREKKAEDTSSLQLDLFG